MRAHADAGAAILNGRGLMRRYRAADGDVLALDSVDIALRAGELLALVGHSGSGKTTLLSIMGLLDRPDGGTLEMFGRDVSRWGWGRLAKLRRGRIGFLFQDAGLIERMPVIENVMLPMRYARVPGARRSQNARNALERVGLGDKVNRLVGTLSGGERQRVGLARALAMQPRFLVCDEPSASLDKVTTGLVAELLREQAQAGAAVVLATHDPLLLPIAGRVLHMERGRFVAGGS
ncbi:ABC-type transport systems ATPase component [Glycocaulis alkaliphilus]|uniref:ABC-type transport systems ATPase component n=1 Tax=Glycocaulis alkaliphilus TaxID=1434191 RepID=A0A3T0E8Y9_9PROT|nr:ABC transporter ATP-binding protein [Glycocaulis alkaliphilus]AZU03548.1 ABC-type transport systems ATPase component [Glycocaulis alkaliphilus]GGB74353.1 ABC transporter ATP-binding protein [Glycocaulis alkaliphilus]